MFTNVRDCCIVVACSALEGFQQDFNSNAGGCGQDVWRGHVSSSVSKQFAKELLVLGTNSSQMFAAHGLFDESRMARIAPQIAELNEAKCVALEHK